MPNDDFTSQQVRETLLASARGIDEVRVEVSADPHLNDFSIVAVYAISFTQESAGRLVILDYSKIRLSIKEVSAGSASVRDLYPELAQRWLLVELPVQTRDSDALRLTLKMTWQSGDESPALPFFLAESFLPRVVVPRAPGQISIPRPVFFQSPDLSPELVSAGLQVDMGDWDPVHHPQLELVLVPKQDALAGAHSGTIFIGEIARALSSQQRADAERQLQHNLERIAATLRKNPGVCAALYPHSKPNSLPREGHVLLLDTPAILGMDSKGRGMETQGLAIACLIWWGAGVRVSGHLGAGIMAAIGQAVALHILAGTSSRSNFDTVRIITERRAATHVDASSAMQVRAFKLSGELGLALFAALDKDASARAVLSQMTEEFWGREVRPDTILARLGDAGVTAPHGLHGLEGAIDG